MGPSTDPAESVYREMRTFVIFALATLAFAAAIESDDIVPETSSTEVVDDMEMVDAGYVAHGDAVSTLKFLQEKEGRSESACRQLADNTIKEISTSITNTQTMLDRLYKGERCHLEMRKEYDAAVRRYNTAKNNLKTAKRRLQDALNYQVDFGRYTFSGLNEGNCRMFWNDGSYRNAKANYHRRKSELQTATGAYNSAKKAKESTYRAHLDAVLRCRCRVKREHSKSWTSANKNNSANAKAWKKAKHMLCVLSNTPLNRCSTAGLRSFRKPRLSSSVTNAKCSEVQQIRVTTGRKAHAQSGQTPTVKLVGSTGATFTGKIRLAGQGSSKTTTFDPPKHLGNIVSVDLKASSRDGWYFTKFEVKSGKGSWKSFGCLPRWLDGKSYDKHSSYAGVPYGDKITLKPGSCSTANGVFIGCYKDNSKRDLPVRKGNTSRGGCKSSCKNYKYFGRQWTNECWCGNSYGKYGKTSGCKCDASNQGGWKNCIYATGK